MKRYFVPLGAFLLGSGLIAGLYFGIMTWAEGWSVATSQFAYNRWFIVPLWLGFGVQAALYAILRLRLFVPGTTSGHTGAMMGASGGTSASTMVACCLHHATDVLPILGLSAAATFLTRYQRPFMLVGVGMNLVGIAVMLRVLYRQRRRVLPAPDLTPALEMK